MDVVSVVLVLLVAALSLSAGLSMDKSRADVDEEVYLRTLSRMQAGEGYYDATKAALTEKEGAPPSQIRSVRPPTEFLVLRWFPSESWRWLAGLVFLAVALLAWRLARDASLLCGPIAVLLVGAYLRAAAPYLYLHAELWGLPLALGGLLCMRRRRWVAAACLLGAAVMVRELYVVFLLAGLVVVPRRRPFVVVTMLVGALGVVHAVLASAILSPDGRESAFTNRAAPGEILDTFGPAGGTVGAVVGVVAIAGGIVALGLLSREKRSDDARTALLGILGLAAVSAAVGRSYWGLTFAPVAACYASMLVALIPPRLLPAVLRASVHPGDRGPGLAVADHPYDDGRWCSDPPQGRSPTPPAPTSSRTPTAG